jgi:autotransporter-associated beta strand protein
MKLRRIFFHGTLVSLALLANSSAATLFWDGGTVNLAGNGNAASNPAANGTWDSGTVKNWDVAPSGSPFVAWSNSFADTAAFAGTARTVTVSGTVQVGSINVATTNYIFNSGTLSFSGGNIDVTTRTNVAFNSALSGSLVVNATANISNTGTTGGIGSITANNTGLTSFELNAGGISNQLLVSNAGSLGPASSTVKLTQGIAGLSAVTGTTYNAWPTTFAGGVLRLRITGTSTYAGNGTLTANTDFATIGGAHLVYSGTLALGTHTLTLAPQSATGAITIQGVISGDGNVRTLNSTTGNADGTGTSTLTNTNTYGGSTTVGTGTLALTGSGSINSSSGITINGNNTRFLQNSSVAVTPTVTLTNGTLTGNGTVNTVNVGAGTGGIISNNNGVAGAALTIGSLTLSGTAAINLFSNSASPALVVGTLTNNSTAGQVMITANNPSGWVNGTTYSLINYTTLGGSGGNNFGQAVNGLSARQSATWTDTGSSIQITINGDRPYWVGDTDNTWNTTTINNWKLEGGNAYTTFLAGDDVLFNDNATAAGPIVVNIDQADVATNVITVNNTTKDYTIESSGGFWIQSGSLIKSGTGALTLNTANKYTGGTTLNAGTLNIGNTTALGASGSLAINGGTIDNTSGAALTTPNYTRTINGNFTFTGTSDLNLGTAATSLGSATGAVRTITTTAGTLTLGGVIADGSVGNGISKSGSGTLVLSGVNTFSGPVTVSAGTLRLGASGTSLANGALGSNASGTTVQSGATLDVVGFNTYAESITIAGTGVGGTGALINTGGTQQNAVQHLTLAADATIGGTGRWDMRQNSATPTLDMGGFTLTKTGANTISLVGVTVSNPGNIDVTSGNFAVQTSTNMGGSATNIINVSDGATLSSWQSTVPLNWRIQLANNATLFAESSAAITQNVWAGPIDIAAGSATLRAEGTASLTGVISGTGSSLIKTGVASVFITNANTYDGSTTINAGSLIAQHASALGTGTTATVANAARLELDNVTISGKAITISGGGTNFWGALQGRSGTSVWAGNVTIAASGTRIGAANGASLEVSGVIDSGANVFPVTYRPENATSTVIVSGANTYLGSTTVLGGVVVAKSLNSVVGGTPSSSFGAPTTVADGTISMSPGAAGILRYVGTGETTDRVVDLSGTTFGATIEQSGASGLLKFTSNFTAIGAGSKTLTLQGSTAAAGEIAGAIVNNSATNITSLLKDGSGTWTLSGTNAFTGGVQINGGTLQLAATGSIATSASINIAPGAKLQTTAQSSFALAGSQPVTFVLDGTGAGSAGMIEASGLTINNAVVNFTVNGALDDTAYVLASYTSKTGAAFASVTPPSGYVIDYSYNSGTQIALVKSGYAAWLAGYPDLADKTEGGDSDFDGIKNVLEYVLNGNPGVSDPTILPTIDAAGANFVFQFTRRTESADDTIQVFEYSTTLGGWTPVNITGTPGASVSFGTPSGGLQTVTVSLPKNGEPRMFGRLKVTK